MGSLELGLLELGLLATALGTAIRFAYDAVSGNRWSLGTLADHRAGLLLGTLLLTIGTLSLMWMPFDLHRAEALRSWRWVIFEPLLAFALARLAIARDGRAPLALSLALPAGVVALGALAQLIDASSSFSVDAVHRSTATYLHPNNLALYLERSLFLVLATALFARDRRRWLLLVLSAVIVAGIGATFSRGAVLGLTAGGAVILLAHPVRRGWQILGAGLAVVVVAFGVLASQRFLGTGSSGVASTPADTSGAMLARDASRLPGSGDRTGPVSLVESTALHRSEHLERALHVSHPHNLVLDSWLSLGLPGLVLFFVFVAAGAWVIWRARSGKLTLDTWQLGALGCLGASLDTDWSIMGISSPIWQL